MRVEQGRANFAPNPIHASDTAAGNDKTLTVPTDEVWRLLWSYVEYTTSATAGNREVRMEITNSEGPLWKVQALDVQAASATQDYHFAASIGEPTDTKAGQQYLPIPFMCLLKEGDQVRIHDVNDVDAAGDVLAVEHVLQKYQE